MNKIINEILSYPQRKLIKMIYSIKEQNNEQNLYDKSTRYKRNVLKKIKKPFNLLYSIFYSKLFYNYMPYSQVKFLSKCKFILNIKKFYFNNLEGINYKTLTPKFKVEFTKEEKSFLSIVKSRPFLRSFPIDINYFRSRYNLMPKFQREVFSCFLKDVEFISNSGFLIQNKFMLIESAFNLTRFLTDIMFPFLIPRRTKMKGVYTSIMQWDHFPNYYHFLIENLPRFYAISKIEELEINLIVPKNYKKFYLDIIKIFLDNRFKIIPIERDEIWELEKFYFASFCSNDFNCKGYIPKVYLDFVKYKIFEHFGIKKTTRSKRIYVSRSRAKRRRLLNEEKLFRILKKYNFVKIHAEDLSFKEQVTMFNSAKIVVGPSGAGLSNIIFSENITLLELYPPEYITQFFFMLCKILGFNYKYIIGYGNFENDDFRVNLNKIENILIELIKKEI